MNKSDKIFIAGHEGMVGSSILRKLTSSGYENIATVSRGDLDLLSQKRVNRFFLKVKPDVVIDCAAKVGGIHANNTYRADFMYSNLQIQNNLIHASYEWGVKKFLFLGSSCIYPKFADQPIKEEYLLASPLEDTNEPYAIAKICGIKMCESYYRQHESNFVSVMPTNLYGPYDNFHPDNSHVFPALIRRFHEAYVYNQKNVEIWGTGKARREFLHVDDLADACVFILENINAKDIYGQGISHLNIGTGEDVSIADLSHMIASVARYEGDISFDLEKPDGTLRKLLDVSRINKLGWKHKIPLLDGIKLAYDWYSDNKSSWRKA